VSIAETYKHIASSLKARAAKQDDIHLRVQYETLAQKYLRLALQAEKNIQNDVVYEPNIPLDQLKVPASADAANVTSQRRRSS
jgi:hypothetical protein